MGFGEEVLAGKYPDLVAFTRGGKDGAIDGVDDTPTGRLIYEAKFVGSSRYDDARRRWMEVRDNLVGISSRQRSLANHKYPPMVSL